MATSRDQRNMHRVSGTSSVRRRLFPADDNEASHDNFFNDLQESAERHRREMTEKWNFDFENEKPLEGKYTWIRFDEPEEWVGLDFENSTKIDSAVDDPMSPLKLKNEVTPKVKNDKSDTRLSLIGKRKLIPSNILMKKIARRRIQF